MATEAEIPAPICDIRNEGREHDRNIVDEATIVSICKLSQEDKIQADEPKEPLTLEGDNFLITPSAGEVQSDIHMTVPEASKVAEKLDQAAKDGPESFLRSLKSGDRPLELGGNEEPQSEIDQKNADDSRSVATVECSKIENLNAEVNMGNDKTGEGKTTDEDTSFILRNDVSKEEFQNIQNTMTTEQETMAGGSQESSALESITETTDDSNPKVTGKIEKNSLTQGYGSHVECNLQLEEENEELPVTKVSTGSTIGHESSVNSNIRDKDKDLKKAELLKIEKDTSTLLEEEQQMEESNSGHTDRATSSLEEQSTGADPQAANSEDTEEKAIDTPETKKEVIEVQGTPKSCLISHEEGNITGDPQEITNTSIDEKCVDEVGMQKDVLEIVSNEEIEENLMIKVDDSQMEIEGLPERGKTPSISLAREANDDELMVRYEVQSEDGQQKKAVLCENEEHALPKIETKIEKEEDTLHVDPEENKASDLGREVEDSQGILDEQPDNKTVDAATREETSSSTLARETKDDQVVMHDVRNEDGQMKKAELCEYEEYAENTLPNLESKMEKKVDTLHVTSEEIKASNSAQKLETSSLEEQSLTAYSQGILDEQTHDKTAEAATREETPYSVTLAEEANDGEVVVEHEVQNEDELKKTELCENEEHADNTLPKAETKTEKGKDTLHAVSEENKPSDLRQEEETSSLEQQSLTADPQGILDEQTSNIRVDAATREEALENVARVDPSEQTEENSLIHFEGLQAKVEEHLEKGSEKPPSIQNFTGNTNEVTLKDEFKLEDENPSAELLEKENNTERSALMDEGHTEKFGKSLNDFGQSTEISCFEEPSLPENQQAILEDKTEDKTIDAEATDHIPKKPQNVATNVLKEDDDQNPSIQVDAPQMKHEEHLEKKMEPSEGASSEKQIQTADLQEIPSDNVEEHIAEVADTTEEDKKDVATNISNRGNDDTSPTEENSSPESSQKEVSTSKSSDHEPDNALEATLEDESSSVELDENEKCTEKELKIGKKICKSTESSSVKLIQTEDLQKDSSDITKKEIAEEANTEEESAKDIATNGETSPTEDYSQQSHTEVPKAGDHEPVNMPEPPQFEDESSLKTELVENEKCPGKEIDNPTTEASSEKQTQPPDPHENLSAKTKEQTTEVADTKEESTKDIATYVPSQENEDSLQVPYQTETSNSKTGDPEPENMLDAEFGEDESSIKSEIVENEKCVDKEVDKPSTGALIKKQIQPADTQEISSDKTKEEITGVVDTEERAQDIAIKVPKQENEDTQEEDDSQIPHLKEASTCKASENELEEKFEDKTSLEAELVENEKTAEKASLKEYVPIEYMHVADKDIETAASVKETETNYVLEQGIDTNTQGVIMDPKEDKAINATDLNVERTQNKDDVTTVTHENNKGISLTQVDEEQYEYLEKVIEPPSEVEVLTGYSTECTLVKQESQMEKSTDSFQLDNKSIQSSTSSQDPGTSSIEEKIITSYLHAISVKTAEETSGASSINKETFDEQNITTNAPSEEKDVSSQGEVDDLQNSSLKEVSVENTNEDYTTFMHEANIEDKNTIITELKERSTEETLTKEESVESLQVVSKEGLACVSGQEGEKTSSSEKECLETNPEKIIYEQKEDKKFDEMDLKVETPETKDIAAYTPRRDSEDNSQVETGTSQNPSLEEALKSESTTIHEPNNPLQEGQEVNDNIVEKTDQNVSTVAEDTGKKCIEQLVVDDTTKSFLGDERHTESELEERGCKQEKVLLDETEDVQESTSTPGATDFITKSPETSELNMFTSGKEVTIDRDGRTKVDEDKDKGEDGSKEKTSDFSHATAEATDQDGARLQSEAPEGDFALKILDDGQEVGSVSVEKTSDSISPCEKDENDHPSIGSMTEDASDTNKVEYAHIENTSSSKFEKQELENIVEDQTCGILLKAEDTENEDEKLKAASEIHNDNVPEEDITSKKNKGEDDNKEYHHVSSSKEDVTTEKQLEGAKQEKSGTKGMHETEKEQKVSEEGVGKDIEQQENLLENESLDRSIDENQVKRSIEEGTTITDAEETRAYAETTIEDSKEGITTDSHQENNTQKEEINIGGTCQDKKEANETEEVSKLSEESAQYVVQWPKEEQHENLLPNESLDGSVDQNQVEKSIEEGTTVVDTEETRVCAETKNEDPKESITTESGPEDDTEQQETKMGETCEAKKDPNEPETISKVSEESAQYVVQGPREEKHENFLANESLDRKVDQNQVEKSIEEATTIVDAEETHVYAKAKTEDSKTGITTESGPEVDTEEEEINIGETCEDKKEANETEQVSKVSEESAQCDVQGPKEEQHENLQANQSLDRRVDQNEVEKSIEEGTTIADTEETRVYAETKTEDSKESITTESGPEDNTEKEEIKIGETCEAKKDPNETEKLSEVSIDSAQYVVQGPKEEKYENLLANESLDRNVDQNQVEKRLGEATTIADSEETHVYAEANTEDSKEGITTESDPKDDTEKEETNIGETCKDKKEANETEKVFKVSEESAQYDVQGPKEEQHENLLANDSLDRSIDQNQVEKSIEEGTTIADTEKIHVYAETKTEDSKESITTDAGPEDDTRKEEIKIGETCEAKKDSNETEKVSKVYEESAQDDVQEAKESLSMHDKCLHQKQTPTGTKDVTTIVNNEKNYEDNVHLETKIEDIQEKVVTESFSEDYVNSKEIDMEGILEVKENQKTEKESEMIEEAVEKAGQVKEEILATAETSLNENEMDSGSKEITNTEAHQSDRIHIERNFVDSKEEIATESRPGDEDAKAFEEAIQEPEEDITAKESIDRSLHPKELENSTKEVATVIHTEEAHGTETDCVHKQTKITDSREEIIAESYPKEESKRQETIEQEICEIKEVADETMKEPKIIEEAKQEPQEDITENKSIDRGLHQEELEENIEEETTVDTERHGADVYLETKIADSREKREAENYQEYEVKQEEIKEKEICEVQNIADETLNASEETLKLSRDLEMVAGKAVQESESANVDGSLQQKESGKSTEKATALFNNVEVHQEDTAKNVVEKEIESYPEETDEIKTNATEIEKVCETFQGDSEQSVQDSEDNLPENVDKSLHQKEQGKSVEEMATTLNTKDVHGIINVCMETGVETSKEKETESYQEYEVKSKEINIEDMCEVKKSGNETKSVSDDSEKVVENVVQEPKKLEKGVEVVTSTPEIEKAHGVHPVHIKTGFEETKEEVAVKAAQEPEEQEKAVELCTATLETENAHGVHPIHMNMGFEESKEEENVMLSERNTEEDAYKADTHSKPTEDEDRTADVEAENGYSSHVKDTSENSHDGSSQDILNSNENSSKECREEIYPNKGNESQISTAGEDVEPLEQTSKTAIPEFIAGEDQLGLLKAAEVERHGEEVSNKRKEMADSNILEAEDQLLKNHDLPQESCIRDSDANIAQSDCPMDLHNVRDIGEDVPKLSEGFIGIPIQDNPVEASPVENKETRVSSEDQKGNITQCVTGGEVTPFSEKDKHVIQEVDCPENVNPGDSTGKNNNVDPAECPRSEGEILKPRAFEQEAKCIREESASQETAKSIEKSDLKDTGKPSLSYLFNASTKENRQTADDPMTSKESVIHRDDHQVGENDNVEHGHAQPGEEKCGDEESDEKIRPDMTYEAPVMVDAGDAEVKIAQKKSHNILSGVGSKVKHSISKVKKAITGKSSHHPKPPSPK